MRNSSAFLLDPVFRFLDRMIHEHGDVLYMLLVFASIPLLVWVLSGGLRRKQRPGIVVPITVIRPLDKPPPQLPSHDDNSALEPEESEDDDSSSFAI